MPGRPLRGGFQANMTGGGADAQDTVASGDPSAIGGLDQYGKWRNAICHRTGLASRVVEKLRPFHIGADAFLAFKRSRPTVTVGSPPASKTRCHEVTLTASNCEQFPRIPGSPNSVCWAGRPCD
jgi:hypothetical protein